MTALLTQLLAVAGSSPLGGYEVVAVALVAVAVAVAVRTRQSLVLATVPVAVAVAPRRDAARPTLLRGQVPDPVHHPLAPRAPGLR